MTAAPGSAGDSGAPERMSVLPAIFGEAGGLAGVLRDFEPRAGQLAMAQAVEAAINDRACLVAEAGTGTGKTLAYLIPAVLSRRRVIISTGTRNLQDQLFHKDLPLVRKVLAVPVQVALLKGRANYLCTYRFETIASMAPPGSVHAEELEILRRWSTVTRSGDIAEIEAIPEDSSIWRNVTSTADNCLGAGCPSIARCHPLAARRHAQDADVLVINHHLLWADWMLKQDGFGELLPDAEVVIVDEAHQFADNAAQFLGIGFGSRQADAWVDDIRSELRAFPGEFPSFIELAERIQRAMGSLRESLGSGQERRNWDALRVDPYIARHCSNLRDALADLVGALRVASARSKGLESCYGRGLGLTERFELLLSDEDADAVRWIELFPRSFRLNRTPIDVAAHFVAFRERSDAAWILTSATLTSDDAFSHFTAALGLDDPVLFRCDSPFDYQRRCLAYVPPDLPDPSSPDHTDRVVDAAVPVLEASEGRAFLLFTSHQALHHAAERLRRDVVFPLFVQGAGPKSALLERFRRSGNGVLLGTSSFWEGVDVRGPALSCVIIDKLPFGSPGDPLLAARIAAARRRGRDPFRSLQLPGAVMSLKQGFGRLIRDAEDRGVLMLGDPRVLTRPYGRVFLHALPAMPLTRDIEDVRRFFAAE